jgi:uncharacterized repeat protein (TIGR03843 family)
MTAGPLDLLARGAVTVKGRLPDSSNATLLVELELDGATGLAVYKPQRGERPLWDFPRGLYRREIAAYLLSEALGWGIVPPTIARDGPHGEGSLQHFVMADFSQHYFTLVEEPAHRPALQRICVFDVIANNADRKSGHCLLGPDGAIYGIDQGLCFHVDPKLRTVMWDWAGEPIPRDLVADLAALVRRGVPKRLARLLSGEEQEVLLARARALVDEPRFPASPGGRSYPWPLV